jgi:3D-(3,5/4)-trihydroxycyclohexane-1,2-dione acylhydrolase (decyclizing)
MGQVEAAIEHIKGEEQTAKLTAAQAIVKYLIAEGVPYVVGIFGHGNAQLGQALYENRDSIGFICVKNEQNAVHIAAAYAKMTGRPLAVTASIGPGSTNLVTGAGAARVNRLPVLLLPGEALSDGVGPVMQQVESLHNETANEALKPVSKYWARLGRPQELQRKLREAFDAMLEPGDQGPATICLPMDVQSEPAEFDLSTLLRPRDEEPLRMAPDGPRLRRAAERLRWAKRPLIIAGGGVLRSGAEEELIQLAELLGAPVVSTQSGRGSILFEHPLNAFTIGPTGTWSGNRLAKKADLVIGIGTRYTDFATASETLFESRPEFVNINMCYFDVGKQRAIKLWGDAKVTIGQLLEQLKSAGVNPRGTGHGEKYTSKESYFEEIQRERNTWIKESTRWRTMPGDPIPQSTALGVINDFIDKNGVVISAAGNLPGDMSKLWRDKDRLGYICEWGFSTMGYEIAGGFGAKLACPDREVIVCVGDMSFLMASQEIVTAVQNRIPYTIVVFDNGGGQSIRYFQKNSGFSDYGMQFTDKQGEFVDVDYAKLGEGMGAHTIKARTEAELKDALKKARSNTDKPTVIHLIVDRQNLICHTDSEGWWDIPRPGLDADGNETELRRQYLAGKAKRILL